MVTRSGGLIKMLAARTLGNTSSRVVFSPNSSTPLRIRASRTVAGPGAGIARARRTANCYDNAAMESFFDTLKSECVERTHFLNLTQARSAIFEYLECFYNPVRLHSTLQYVSPLVYEQAFAQSVR